MLVFGLTSIRGNTTLSEWPKPPPARREGSSVLFFSQQFMKPAKAKRETRTICRAANRSCLYERALYFATHSLTALRGRRPRARGGAMSGIIANRSQREVLQLPLTAAKQDDVVKPLFEAIPF